eukprot:364339-Chlamydomonas_euryale.AAC.13
MACHWSPVCTQPNPPKDASLPATASLPSEVVHICMPTPPLHTNPHNPLTFKPPQSMRTLAHSPRPVPLHPHAHAPHRPARNCRCTDVPAQRGAEPQAGRHLYGHDPVRAACAAAAQLQEALQKPHAAHRRPLAGARLQAP